MKLDVKKKRNIKICIILLEVLLIIVGICYIKGLTFPNDKIKDNAYIDIWRDTSMDLDFALESRGSGKDKEIYLGKQPVHYLVNKDGKVYTYEESSFENAKTGKRKPAKIEYIKSLSESDLKNLENDLKSIKENNDSNSPSWNYWFIKINGTGTRVNIDLKKEVLDKYF